MHIFLTKPPRSVPTAFWQYINDLCVLYHKAFAIQDYTGTVVYDSDRDEDDDYETLADICIDSVYMTFTLTVRPAILARWKDRDYWGVASTVAHEFCHFTFAPITRLWRSKLSEEEFKLLTDLEEQQVVRLTNVIVQMLPRGFHQPARLSRIVSKI